MKKALAIILAIAMFASIGAFLLSKRSEPKTNDVMTVNETENFTLATSIYTTRIDVAGANGEKYLPTFVDGIYYTATLDGTVKFYEYSQGKFTPSAAEVKKASVKMNISKDSIPVTINYIVAGGKTIGYGVYTSDKGGSDYYEYAFAELRNMPEGYGTSYLLLADYDKEDFYKADKAYDEIFEYDLAAKSVGVKYSQNTRLIDHNGTYRQDWAMLTDAFIKGMGSEKYFLSSRYYNENEKYLRCDVMVYSSAYRPTIVVKDIMGQWFVKDDAGMHYIYQGTSGWASTVCAKSTVDTSAMIAAIVGADKKTFNYFAELETAGKCLEWVKDHIALDEVNIYLNKTHVAESKETEYTSLYDYLSKIISETEPGCGGVVFTPWLHGNRCPFEDPNSRGMFFNLSLDTGKTQIIRSVIEGVCYHMRWFLETQDKKVKTSEVVRFVGGGALSDVTCQILADITGKTIETVDSPQNVGAVGAAVIMAVGLGIINDVDEAKKLVPAKKVFRPSTANKAIYDRNYAVYKTLYKNNKEAFKALNAQ